jgi:hypothetical protein
VLPAAADSTILFVHGAHLAGWCWLLVMDRLGRRGFTSSAVDLPFTGFDDDVQCVRAAVESLADHTSVHLVCHSYGGLPAAAGGHGASHLTFVASRLPLQGESPAAATGEWRSAEYDACTAVDDDGVVRLSLAASDVLFNSTPASLADLATARLRPMGSVVPDEPLEDPAWRLVPSSYVVCADDRAVHPGAQRERALLVDDAIELSADHCPFFSAPDELADFIADRPLRAVERVGDGQARQVAPLRSDRVGGLEQ